MVDSLHQDSKKISSSEAAVSLIGSNIIALIHSLITDDVELARKLSKACELGSIKRKEKQYEALAHYVVDEPQTLVRALCSWYMVWGCVTAMTIICELSWNLGNLLHEDAVKGLDAETLVVVVSNAATLVESCHQNRAMDSPSKSLTRSYATLLCWVINQLDVDHTRPYVEQIVNEHAVTIEKHARAILQDSDQKIACDSSGFLRCVMFPSFSICLLRIHVHFGASHGSVPLDLQTKKSISLFRINDGPLEWTSPWSRLLGSIGELRNVHLCAHLSCRESL